MIITYDCVCFERELTIIFPDGYEWAKEEVEQLLDDYYIKWNNVEDIEDPDEQNYVQYSCLEEYMMECLSEVYNQWEEWSSVYYGEENDEEI